MIAEVMQGMVLLHCIPVLEFMPLLAF